MLRHLVTHLFPNLAVLSVFSIGFPLKGSCNAFEAGEERRQYCGCAFSPPSDPFGIFRPAKVVFVFRFFQPAPLTGFFTGFAALRG